MNNKLKKRLLDFGANIFVFLHFLIVIIYFIAIPLMFIKGVISLIAAIYVATVWVQYKLLKGCIITFLENYFLRKQGKKTHEHFISRQLSKIAHGNDLKGISKSKVDIISWHVKTFFFVVSTIVIAIYFVKFI